MFSIQEILDLAIRLEKNGESVYRTAAAKLFRADLVSLLVWMADEEVKHARWFSFGVQKREWLEIIAHGDEQPVAGFYG